MKLYLSGNGQSADKDIFIDVVGMVAKICNKNQHAKEKFLGLDFLGFIPRGDGSDKDCHLAYLVDEKVRYQFGLESEAYLVRLCKNLLSNKEYIHLVDFYFEKGILKERLVKVKNNFSGQGRSSRRYLLLFYKGKFVFTDVARLNNLTLHYKKSRDRNERGLEWENYSNLLTHGSPFR